MFQSHKKDVDICSACRRIVHGCSCLDRGLATRAASRMSKVCGILDCKFRRFCGMKQYLTLLTDLASCA
jgi:hypothetical protein